MKTIRDIVIGLLILATCFYGGFHFGKNHRSATVQSQTDTLIVRDTVIRIKPEYIDKLIVRTEKIEVRDTVRELDTLFIEVPIESRHYRDSLYDAWVSGYHASLDSIKVYPTTTYITTTNTVTVPDRKRWGIGVQAGYGIGKDGFSPYVGVGLSYDIIRF